MCTFSTAMLLSVLTLKELAVRAVLLEKLPTGELPKTLKEEMGALSRLEGVYTINDMSLEVIRSTDLEKTIAYTKVIAKKHLS